MPAGFGLLYVDEEPTYGNLRRVEWERRAPRRPGHEPLDLPARTERALMLRLAQAEAQAKGYGWDKTTAQADTEELRARVERLQRDLEIALDRASRADDRARYWQRRYGAGNPVPCGTCGKALKPAAVQRRRLYGEEWKHAEQDEAVCKSMRATAEIAKPYYSPGYVPGPEPVDLILPEVS